MKIRYIHSADIDVAKWDSCISGSVNGIVYAYSWYLDIVAGQWDALVGDNYDAVFPLVSAQKYGISYLYQPLFTQQLGLFSTKQLNTNTVNAFLSAIPAKYRYININLNTFTRASLLGAAVNSRVTYQLDLIEPFRVLSSRYSANTKRNVSKSVAYGVTVLKGGTVDDFIAFKKEHEAVPISPANLNKLRMIIAAATGSGQGEVYMAYSNRNELCAAAFFIRSNGKVIYLSAASSPQGKGSRAMFGLIDCFLMQNSESRLVLDFEGSTIPSIARFYAGFGATPSNYDHVRINRLPWPLKLMLP
ncbi:MAG: hypothetical protein JW783_06130 [Bacteroidales bacterium]|nr:hypothetical protein [Bacteroidales bacterium]MBN2750294.1 hypothetical protein [Bacteroidales bacterium]